MRNLEISPERMRRAIVAVCGQLEWVLQELAGATQLGARSE